MVHLQDVLQQQSGQHCKCLKRHELYLPTGHYSIRVSSHGVWLTRRAVYSTGSADKAHPTEMQRDSSRHTAIYPPTSQPHL